MSKLYSRTHLSPASAHLGSVQHGPSLQGLPPAFCSASAQAGHIPGLVESPSGCGLQGQLYPPIVARPSAGLTNGMRIARASAELPTVPLPNQRTRRPVCHEGRRMVMGRNIQRRSLPGAWSFKVLRGNHFTCRYNSKTLGSCLVLMRYVAAYLIRDATLSHLVSNGCRQLQCLVPARCPRSWCCCHRARNNRPTSVLPSKAVVVQLT